MRSSVRVGRASEERGERGAILRAAYRIHVARIDGPSDVGARDLIAAQRERVVLGIHYDSGRDRP